jgi:hypothetical protein
MQIRIQNKGASVVDMQSLINNTVLIFLSKRRTSRKKHTMPAAGFCSKGSDTPMTLRLWRCCRELEDCVLCVGILNIAIVTAVVCFALSFWYTCISVGALFAVVLFFFSFGHVSVWSWLISLGVCSISIRSNCSIWKKGLNGMFGSKPTVALSKY